MRDRTGRWGRGSDRVTGPEIVAAAPVHPPRVDGAGQDVVNPTRSIIRAADVAAGRLNVLQGIYWGGGGLLIVVAVLLGAFPDGHGTGMLVVGGGASILGAAMLATPRMAMPRWAHVLLSLLGGATISLLVLLAGETNIVLPGVLFVYLPSFAFVGLRRQAFPIIGVASVLHLGILVYRSPDGVVGIWLLTWGVALTAGIVIGEVVESIRRALVRQSQLLDELREADAAKTALLHAVHHELSRPMTAMVGLSQTLLDRGDGIDPGARQQILERISSSTVRLRDTLQELLGLSRIAEGQVHLDLERLPLRSVVDLALDHAEVAPDRIAVAVPQDLEVVVDRARLGHAIANLVTNAVRYGDGSPIELRALRRGDDVEVRVRDGGPGVPDQVKRAVFEPYVRAKDVDIDRGSGLGLSLVRQFLRLHGGTAWLEDAPGGARGTEAVLRFPQEGPDEPATPDE